MLLVIISLSLFFCNELNKYKKITIIIILTAKTDTNPLCCRISFEYKWSDIFFNGVHLKASEGVDGSSEYLLSSVFNSWDIDGSEIASKDWIESPAKDEVSKRLVSFNEAKEDCEITRLKDVALVPDDVIPFTEKGLGDDGVPEVTFDISEDVS